MYASTPKSVVYVTRERVVLPPRMRRVRSSSGVYRDSVRLGRLPFASSRFLFSVCVFSPCANVSTRHPSVSRHWPLLCATTWHTYASTPWRARCISYGPSCTRARFPAPTDHQDSDPSTTNKYSKAPLKSSTPATTALLRYPSKSTLASSHSDGTPLS